MLSSSLNLEQRATRGAAARYHDLRGALRLLAQEMTGLIVKGPDFAPKF